MNFFLWRGHLDTFSVVAQLHKLKPNFNADGTFMLRDVAGKEAPAFVAWKSLQRLLKQARSRFQSAEDYHSIFIERLNSGVATGFEKEASPDYLDFVVPLVTNPFAQEHAQNEAVHMPAGSLWWVNNSVYRLSANWGEQARYHLVVQIKRAGVDTDEEDTRRQERAERGVHKV